MKWTTKITAVDIDTGEVIPPSEILEYKIIAKEVLTTQFNEKNTKAERHIRWTCKRLNTKQGNLFSND